MYKRDFFSSDFIHNPQYSCFCVTSLRRSELQLNTLSILFCFDLFLVFVLDSCEIYYFFVTCGLCSHSNPIFIYVAENSIIFFLYIALRELNFSTVVFRLWLVLLILSLCVYYSFFLPLLARSFTHFYSDFMYVCTHTPPANCLALRFTLCMCVISCQRCVMVCWV